MKQFRFILIILFLTANFACENKIAVQEENKENEFHKETTTQPPVKISENLIKAMKAVEPFFKPMDEPTADEWLAAFKENGQTFEQYFNSNPVLPSPERKTLYVQPIGEFDGKQLKIIRLAVEYMQKFFGLPVKLLTQKKFDEPLSLRNYRINQFTRKRQILTSFVLEEILLPKLPHDAAALIAFTNEDLFPDKNTRYVFGQASLKNRVGVWSLFRLDDFANYEKFLRRTLKVAVHETGHMFSFAHCTKYECVMSGTNHLSETDKRPVDVCPECMAKICWMSGYEPEKRYQDLAEFCRTHNLTKDYEEFSRKAAVAGKN
jgi:archaemetzincin